MSRTIVELRCLKTPVTYAEGTVRYDSWGTPYVTVALRGYHNPWNIVLEPGGKTNEPFTTEWRVKIGPSVKFPENLSEQQSRGWSPTEP